MKVVILGKGLMLANIVLGVKDAGAEIAGVFRYEYTCENPIKLFIKDTFNPEPEVTLIKQMKLRQIKMKSANCDMFRKFLLRNNIDLVIIGTWKERLKKETFDLPKIAAINVHPSLLPKYRGPNPYLQTILNGEKESGVTLHLVDGNYDSGAILSQAKVPIKENDTSKELRERTVQEARRLVCEFIQDLDYKIITPIEQSQKYATYFPNISGDEKMLDFTFQTSDEISRTARALHPFLPCYITYENKFFIVNPYKMQIQKQEIQNAEPGDIIAKNADKYSLTIVCKDNRAIRFAGLTLYKAKFLTKRFIKNKVQTKC